MWGPLRSVSQWTISDIIWRSFIAHAKAHGADHSSPIGGDQIRSSRAVQKERLYFLALQNHN